MEFSIVGIRKKRFWPRMDLLYKILHLYGEIFYVSQWISNFLFPKFWGLKQGDPLSSYLFELLMKAQSYFLSKAEEEGFISDFKVTRHVERLWRLFMYFLLMTRLFLWGFHKANNLFQVVSFLVWGSIKVEHHQLGEKVS